MNKDNRTMEIEEMIESHYDEFQDFKNKENSFMAASS